jgi:hypothetical protein
MRSRIRLAPSAHGSVATPRRRIACKSAARKDSSDGAGIGDCATDAPSRRRVARHGAGSVVEIHRLLARDLIGEQPPDVVFTIAAAGSALPACGRPASQRR